MPFAGSLLAFNEFDRVRELFCTFAEPPILTGVSECCRDSEVADADWLNAFAPPSDSWRLNDGDRSLKLTRNDPARFTTRLATASADSSSFNSKTYDTESHFSTTPLITGDDGGDPLPWIVTLPSWLFSKIGAYKLFLKSDNNDGSW